MNTHLSSQSMAGLLGASLSTNIIKDKHGDLDDDLILKLVKSLDGGNFEVQAQKDDFEYFAVEPVFEAEKAYRLVLLLCIYDDYLGVVNAFRVRRKTK